MLSLPVFRSLLFLALLLGASPPPLLAFTRKDAIEYALKNNPSFRTFRANVTIALASFRGTQVFPTNPELESVGKVKVPGKPNPLDFKILENELTWKMPIGGWWQQEQRLAKAFLERVRYEVRAQRFFLVMELHRAYNEVLLGQEKVKLYSDIIQFFERVVKLTTTLKLQGSATILNVNLVRLELLQNQASMKRAAADLLVKRQKFAKVLGWDKNTLPDVKSPLPTSFQNFPNLDALFIRAASHIRLQVAQKQIKQAEVAIQFAEAKAIPDLKLKIYYALEQELNHSVGLGLSIPLPILFRNQQKIWESRAKLQQALLKLAEERFKIRQEIRESFLRYTQLLEIYKLYQDQLLPQFREQLRLLSRSLQLGNIQLLQLVTTQKSQLKAMLERLEALSSTLDGYISLYEAIGELPTNL